MSSESSRWRSHFVLDRVSESGIKFHPQVFFQVEGLSSGNRHLRSEVTWSVRHARNITVSFNLVIVQ